MKQELIKDIATMNNVKKTILDKFINSANYIICDYINELEISDIDNIIDINIGIGVLTISKKDSIINYRFKPTKKLEKAMIETIVSGENPMTQKLATNLENKITKLYKGLL